METARWRHVLQTLSWLLIITGAVVVVRSFSTSSLVGAIWIIAVGFAGLEVLLFVNPGAGAWFTRPVGQMIIATCLTLILNAVPFALFKSAVNVASAASDQAFNLSIVDHKNMQAASMGALGALLVVAWAIALPTYAWWRWFGETKRRADA